MFYSHEILTSRKYGVATIWLVATLGARPTVKKINRKAILDVEVAKACETILAPDAPLALRLQGNLLYGLSGVFSRQCGYVLLDAQQIQNTLRALLKPAGDLDVDPQARRARPANLLLEDDPNFSLEAGLPMMWDKLPVWNVEGIDSLLSPLEVNSGQPSACEDGAGSPVGAPFVSHSESGMTRNPSQIGLADAAMAEDEGAWLLPDLGFEFDEEGNMRDVERGEAIRRQIIARPAGARIYRSSVASGRVREEHEQVLRAKHSPGQGLDQGEDFRIPDEVEALPEAEPLPVPDARHRSIGIGEHPEAAVHTSSPMPEASIGPRRQRSRKILELDVVTEIPYHELVTWNQNYVGNMTVLAQDKASRSALTQAKSNAEFWVFGGGLGSWRSTSLTGQLSELPGTSLLEHLRRKSTITQPDIKRKHEADTVDEEGVHEDRRIRHRTNEDGVRIPERGRVIIGEDGAMIRVDDDYDGDDLEVGREALPELQDISTALPWNISASLRGSRQGSSVHRGRGVIGSSLGGYGSSVTGGRASSVFSIASRIPLQSRRTSRAIGSSPQGVRVRGSSDLIRLSSLELPDADEASQMPENPPSADENQGAWHDDDFDMIRSSPPVSEMPAARGALEQETLNFLEFVRADLEDAQRQQEASGISGERPRKTAVTFEELLRPWEHSRMVAAQGFSHVLSLATKALIEVQQNEPYGVISLVPID